MLDARGCEFGAFEKVVVLMHMEMLPKYITMESKCNEYVYGPNHSNV
jgi:hypothetical protein